MYKLHIYNPEHDMSLARNDAFFTPPKAALLMRQRYGHIPALWAEDGDWVLVDDIENARRMLLDEKGCCAKVKFVTINDLAKVDEASLPCEIQPWGWDRPLVRKLLNANPLLAPLMPSDAQLDKIRELSSRRFASEEILPLLRSIDSSLVGEMTVFSSSLDELELLLSTAGALVLKSPWSCSGRGVRMTGNSLTDSERGWCRRVLHEQGCLMVEPLYDRVLDIGAEFMIEKDGRVSYLGMNLFETSAGAFKNNLSLSPPERRQLLLGYISEELYNKVVGAIQNIASQRLSPHYSGPFGVDMMIVKTENGYALHPCVELNLRRTMGHTAV